MTLKKYLLFILVVYTFSRCSELTINPAIEKPIKIKTYPPLENSVSVKFIPIYSVWQLSDGGCLDSSSNFNALVPLYTNFKNKTEHADVGCVAVAMGQIMNYWKQPNIFDWSQMRDSCSTRETAKLMMELGKILKMKYNVDKRGSSGISFNEFDYITNAFKEYNYSSEYAAFNLDTVINEINHNRPVILIGCAKSFCHAWIVNGYGLDSKNELHFFMNWGLPVGATWSSATNWNVGKTFFDTKRIMVYNIKLN